MRHIRINRTTTEGLKKVCGYLYEYNWYQFCLCEVDNSYYIIELSTGFGCFNLNKSECKKSGISETDAFNNLTEKLKKLKPQTFQKALLNAITKLKGYDIEYPVNKPIIN